MLVLRLSVLLSVFYILLLVTVSCLFFGFLVFGFLEDAYCVGDESDDLVISAVGWCGWECEAGVLKLDVGLSVLKRHLLCGRTHQQIIF